MNMTVSTPFALGRTFVPLYWLGDAKSVTVDGAKYTLVKQTPQHSELRNQDGVVQAFTHETLYLYHLQNKLEIDRDGVDISPLKLGRDIIDVDVNKARRALILADAFNFVTGILGKKDQALSARGWKRKATLGVDCLRDHLIPLAQAMVYAKWIPKSGAGSVIKLVEPRQFRRLYHLYIDGGCDPAVLVSRRTGPGAVSGIAKAHPADLRLWNEYALKYATPTRPSMRACLQMLRAKIEECNNELPAGARLIQAPSRSTFEAMIKGLGEFFLHAARYGEDAAKKRFAPVRDGLLVEAPGQRVEMDEWKIDLSALLTLTPVYDLLSADQRAELKKTRMWVTVAIDVATRCILALRFSTRAPSAHSSIAALEMVVTDKQHIAEVAGALSPWFHSLVPRELVTDAGAAFIDTSFRQPVAALRCIHTIPPAGMASARGTVESVFRTFGQRFLHYFEGRSFGSVDEKGDYEGDKRAVLKIDELCAVLTRAIVDIYHNEPHGGLAGETPANAWLRLCREYPVIPPVSQRQRRLIFGTQIIRKVSPLGIRFLGIQYQSRELQRLWAERAALPNSPALKVKVRVDRFDLRTISYFDGTQWVDLTTELKIPEGVSVWEWTEAMTEVGKLHRRNAKINLSAMLAAVNALRESGSAAAARAELGTDIPSMAAYRKVEKERFAWEITDDLLSAADLSALAVPHDPLATSVEEFRFLAGKKEDVEKYFGPYGSESYEDVDNSDIDEHEDADLEISFDD